MGVKLWINRGKIYLSICEGGRQYRESTGLSVCEDDKDQNKQVMLLAKIIRSKRETQLVSGAHGILDPVKSKMLFIDYAKQKYDNDPKAHKLKWIIPYLEKHGAGIKLENLNSNWVKSFQKFLQAAPDLSANSAENYMLTVRAIINQAYIENGMLENPCKSVEHIKKTENQITYLTTEDITLLIKTPLGGDLGLGGEVKRAFLFAICTALRISDIKTLRWGDIDQKSKALQKIQKKTGSIVLVPIKGEAWNLIDGDAIHNAKEYVFPLLASSNTNTRDYLSRWGRMAGVPKLTGWHIARRTAATQLTEAGVDVFTTMKILGHIRVETTQRYADVTDNKRRKAVDALPDYGIEAKEIKKQ